MRKLAISAVMAAWLCSVSTVTYADEVDDLVAQGEARAKEGEWSLAIIAFKAADARRPRANHACLIGLAYTRRELWPQAELYLSLCRTRATDSDPAPDWAADAEKTLGAKLKTSNAVPVAITVVPATAGARIAVSSFAPDETFTPRAIHLAPGSHTIRVTSEGYLPMERTIVVAADPLTVTFELRRDVPPVPPSKVPRYVLYGAAGLGTIAIGYHMLVARPSRNRLAESETNGDFELALDTFHSRRRWSYALYGAAAVTTLVGVALRLTIGRGEKAPVHVGAMLGHGGGMIAVEWRR